MSKGVKLEVAEDIMLESIACEAAEAIQIFTIENEKTQGASEAAQSKKRSRFLINTAGFKVLVGMEHHQIDDFITTAGYFQHGYNGNCWKITSDEDLKKDKTWLNHWTHKHPVYSNGHSEKDRHFSVAAEIWARCRPFEREQILSRMTYYTIQ